MKCFKKAKIILKLLTILNGLNLKLKLYPLKIIHMIFTQLVMVLEMLLILIRLLEKHTE